MSARVRLCPPGPKTPRRSVRRMCPPHPCFSRVGACPCRRSTPQGLVIGTACPPVSAVLPQSAMPCVRRAGCRHASFAAFSQSPLLLQQPFCERPAFWFLGPCAPASYGTAVSRTRLKAANRLQVLKPPVPHSCISGIGMC